MEPGDVLVMYTDGVTEAMGPAPTPVPALESEAASLAKSEPVDDEEEDEDDEPVLPFFEEERLVEICVARRHESAEQIRAALLAAIRNFAQDVSGSSQPQFRESRVSVRSMSSRISMSTAPFGTIR